MDHSLIRLPLSENFSAQYTQLTHFTHTPAQTQHRNHSLPHSLIYTEFLRYNYNCGAFHKRTSTHRVVQTQRFYLYTAIRGAGSVPGFSQPMPIREECAGFYFCWRISHPSSYYFFFKGNGRGKGSASVKKKEESPQHKEVLRQIWLQITLRTVRARIWEAGHQPLRKCGVWHTATFISCA